MKSSTLSLHGDLSPLVAIDQDEVHLAGKRSPDPPENRPVFGLRWLPFGAPANRAFVPLIRSPQVSIRQPVEVVPHSCTPNHLADLQDRLATFQHAISVPRLRIWKTGQAQSASVSSDPTQFVRCRPIRCRRR